MSDIFLALVDFAERCRGQSFGEKFRRFAVHCDAIFPCETNNILVAMAFNQVFRNPWRIDYFIALMAPKYSAT